MSEHDVMEDVEHARRQLEALRLRFETTVAPAAAHETVSVLRELAETLERLQSRHALLREALDQSNDLLFAKHCDGRYALVNPRGAELIGKSASEIIGARDGTLFGSAGARRILAVEQDVMSSGIAQTREDTCSIGGVMKTLLTTTTVWYDAQRNVRGVIGVARDVTDRRERELSSDGRQARLRAWTVDAVLEEESLRRVLAAELHTGLGQDIAVARLNLAKLSSAVDKELREPLNAIEGIIEHADRSLRSITFRVSAPSLHNLGFVAALEWLAEELGRTHALRVRVADRSSPPVVDERIRVLLLRAVRELLVNVATHADVGAAEVQLEGAGEAVRLTVTDEGCGFDPTDFDRRGYGLFGIREQLKHVGGSIHVTSECGRGTTVILLVPTAAPLAKTTNA